MAARTRRNRLEVPVRSWLQTHRGFGPARAAVLVCVPQRVQSRAGRHPDRLARILLDLADS